MKPEVRRVNWVEVPAPTISTVEARLLDLKPSIERHFELSLTGCAGTQFLAYGPGDFYLPHRYTRKNPNAALGAKQRQISIVMFLNSESAEPQNGCYCGGALTFYGLMQANRSEAVGLPLIGEAGLLIAFPSGILPRGHARDIWKTVYNRQLVRLAFIHS